VGNNIYSSFHKKIHQLPEETNAEAQVPEVKSKIWARMKAQFKYRDSNGTGVAWHRLTDLVRATLIFTERKSQQDIHHIIAQILCSIIEVSLMPIFISSILFSPQAHPKTIHSTNTEATHTCKCSNHKTITKKICQK